jgi:hypothetical protein
LYTIYIILIDMNNDVLIIGQMYAETDEEVLMYEKCVQSLKKMGCKIMIADSSSCHHISC